MVDPVSSPTDAQGNVLPPQGAAPGQQPAAPAILAGVPSLADSVAAAYMTHLTRNQPPPVSSVVADAKAKAAAASPVVERPQPAPGTMGAKMMGAADEEDAAATGGLSSLGDIAHATDRPGGWLTGMVNTANARKMRIEQEKKDAALLAKTQAETVAMHRNMYQQDAVARQSAYDHNQGFVNTFKVNHDIEDGLTHDQLMKRVQGDKDFAKNYYVRATGEEPVLDANGEPRKDKFGNPITSPLYTVVSRSTKDGQPDDKTVTPEMSAAIQKYLGTAMPQGTKLTGLQYAALDGQIGLTRNAVNILQNTNGKDMSDEQLKSLSPYLTDPTIQAAISHVPGNAYAGLKQYADNANDHLLDLQAKAEQAKAQKNQAQYDQYQAQIAQIQEEKNKVTQFTSQSILPKQIEEYEKKQGDTTDFLKDLQKKADGAHGEEAAGIAASTRKLLENNPQYPDGVKKTLARIISQTDASAKASADWEADKERKKQELSNALAEGDVDTLVDAAKNYQLDPNKLYSMRKNTNAQFKSRLLQEDPTWSEATYKQRYDIQQDLASRKTGSLGASVESLNTFTGHLWDANGLIATLQNTRSPLLNKGINEVKLQLGNDKIHPYEVALEAAGTEYINFLNNQHAKTAADEKLTERLTNANTSPADAQAILRQMAQTVAIRARSANHRYNTIMGGKDIPGLLEPESKQILQNFGINPQEVFTGKTIPSTGQTANKPVFDSKKWATANPGKDVNAAIAQAKAKGYEVTQ